VGTVTNPVTALEWNGDIWAVAAQGLIYTSPNGTSWSSNAVPTSVFQMGNGGDLEWSGTAWYAVGCNAAGDRWAVARSLDASNWSLMTVFSNEAGNVFQPYISGRRMPGVVSGAGPAGPAGAPGGASAILVTEVSGTSLTLASSNYNTHFYLTNGGFNAVALPASTLTTDGGNYWSLRNSTNTSLSITLTNTLNLTSPLIIPSSNTQTLVISSNTSNTILLL
jgi:hypothetical protein